MVTAPIVRLDSLTGLRFAAAFLVFGFHGALLVPEGSLEWVGTLFRAGPVGVSFFFWLSGFVLTWSRRQGERATAFYQRRVARIVPNHLVTWVLGLGMTIAEGSYLDRKGTLASLLLVHSWFPTPLIFFAINAVTWSLACEMFFYGLFPFVIPWLERAERATRRVLMVLLLVAVVAIAAWSHRRLGGWTQFWFPYIFPLSRLPEFVLGMLLALEVRAGAWPHLRLTPLLVLGAGAYFAAVWVPESFLWVSVTLVPFAFIIAAAAQVDMEGEGSPFRHPLFVRLGEWSFAFYLVHALVIRVAAFVGLQIESVVGLLWLPLLLVASVALSGLLFTVVERPLERRLRPRPIGVGG